MKQIESQKEKKDGERERDRKLKQCMRNENRQKYHQGYQAQWSESEVGRNRKWNIQQFLVRYIESD